MCTVVRARFSAPALDPEPAMTQKRVDAGSTAAEGDKKVHRFTRPSLREDRVAKATSGLLGKIAFLECCERVGREDLCPFVAVVTGCISTGKDMREAVGHSIPFGRPQHAHFAPHGV